MKDCTTCKHCENCLDFFSCEIHTNVREEAELYIGRDCDDYEERGDGLILVQVWGWR